MALGSRLIDESHLWKTVRNVTDLISHLGSTAATPEVIAALAQLLSDRHLKWDVLETAAEAIEALGLAALTPESLAALAHLVTEVIFDERRIRSSGRCGSIISPAQFIWSVIPTWTNLRIFRKGTQFEATSVTALTGETTSPFRFFDLTGEDD